MRLLQLAFTILTFVIISSNIVSVEAQTRFAQCDVCGYCRDARPGEAGQPTPVQVPGNWQDCRRCMYPDLGAGTVNATDNKTLLVDSNASSQFFNVQVTPKPGRYYTQVGCIVTDLNSFSERGAAAGLVNSVLRLVFNVAGGIALMSIIYGAYVIMTARGDAARLNQGRSIVFSAIFGLIFVLLVTLILNFIGSGVLRIPGFNT